jgi:hypothetical protein
LLLFAMAEGQDEKWKQALSSFIIDLPVDPRRFTVWIIGSLSAKLLIWRENVGLRAAEIPGVWARTVGR